MNTKDNNGKAEGVGKGGKESLDDLLKDLHDPVTFQGYTEALALACYVKSRYGARPYQKDASWKPLLRFKVKTGDKESTDVSVTVFYPNGEKYRYVRFSVVTCNKSGFTLRHMPLTLDQTIRLIQDIQDPFSYTNRLTGADHAEGPKPNQAADA